MANLSSKNGVFLARFRFRGKEYKRSLKTRNRKSAEAAMHRVEDALHRLAIQLLTIPEGVDAGDFILSGGALSAPTPTRNSVIVPTVDEAIQVYTHNLGHLAPLNRATIRTHLGNLKKQLGPSVNLPLNQIEVRDLEGFLQNRLKERSPTTVSKERLTLKEFFDWTVKVNYLRTSPAAKLTRVKSAGDRPPFRTYRELEEIVGRGGLSSREILRLWDCLYLSPEEISDLLALIRERSVYEVTPILHVIPAYTGMRRGEVLRLRWSDIEFDQDAIIARSLKQSRQTIETARRIDLHSELKAILLAWRERRPTGQLVVCDPGRLDMLTSRETSGRFYYPLRGTKWCLSSRSDWFKIGFHTYRHSFASNLAAAGVDQRVVDEWMGHQTEAMRKRYRHLFPKTRRSAIESFSLAAQG
jgi:integrase